MRFDDQLPDANVNVSKQHPLRDAAMLTLGVIGLCVLLVFAVAGAINLAVPLIPPSVEEKVFSVIDLDDAMTMPEDADPRAEYIQKLVDDLASHWPELPFPLHASVLEDPVPNAFAVPGGRIMVTQGLLDSVGSETELAFVLGHEIGHFQQRDHLRGLGRGLALVLVSYGLDLGGARGAMSLLQGAMGIADRHFDRDQESGADVFGLGLVQHQYGHVSGATDFFGRRDDFEFGWGEEPSEDDDDEPSESTDRHDTLDRKLEGYFSTHPVDEERAEALNQLADRSGWPRDQSPQPLNFPEPVEPPDAERAAEN